MTKSHILHFQYNSFENLNCVVEDEVTRWFGLGIEKFIPLQTSEVHRTNYQAYNVLVPSARS